MISERDELNDDQIRRILAYVNVAVVGASRDPTKPAHYVPRYLLDRGYNVIPVNPSANEIFGRKSNARLADVVERIDIVDIFRPSADVLPVVQEAVRKGVKVVWMQEGIYNRQAVEEARKSGVIAVWDRCMMKEHERLLRG